MIFDSNRTSLGVIAMAEGYDKPYSAAQMMVESAQNDLKMFYSLMDVEAKETQIRESYSNNGYVMESEVSALAEAAGSGIWARIKELFKKIIAKIKAIFNTFVSKLDSLFMTDKGMVKKYRAQINKKSNIGNMYIAWADIKNSPLKSGFEKVPFGNPDGAVNKWDEDADKRFEFYLKQVPGCGSSDESSMDEDIHDYFFDELDKKVQLKDAKGVSSIQNIMAFLESSTEKTRQLKRDHKDWEKSVNDTVKKIEQFQTDVSKRSNAPEDYEPKLVGSMRTGDGNMTGAQRTARATAISRNADKEIPNSEYFSEDSMKRANKIYDMAVAWQNFTTKYWNCILNECKYEYKQYKAAFMKAIAANNEKLKESYSDELTYADLIEEATCEEVDGIFDNYISHEDLSDAISDAPKSLLAGGVSCDGDHLTYDIDDRYKSKYGLGNENSPYSPVGESGNIFDMPLF